MIDKNAKIYVAGHRGMVGSALVRRLQQAGYSTANSKPDGTPRKLLDVGRLRGIGWQARTPLREGIALAYRDFLACHGG